MIRPVNGMRGPAAKPSGTPGVRLSSSRTSGNVSGVKP